MSSCQPPSFKVCTGPFVLIHSVVSATNASSGDGELAFSLYKPFPDFYSTWYVLRHPTICHAMPLEHATVPYGTAEHRTAQHNYRRRTDCATAGSIHLTAGRATYPERAPCRCTRTVMSLDVCHASRTVICNFAAGTVLCQDIGRYNDGTDLHCICSVHVQQCFRRFLEACYT